MSYSEVSPGRAKAVVVEWLDITGSSGDPGLTRRWTLGYLLSSTYISEGRECTVLGNTWDEDGWTDTSTFPNSIIVGVEKV
jgi:hypothetical protein